MTNEEILKQFKVGGDNSGPGGDSVIAIIAYDINMAMDAAREDEAGKWETQLKEERERSKKLLEAEEERTNYWVSGCMAAEQCIEKSPCDPDITKDQIEAHRNCEAAKKNENNNQ